MTTPTLELFYGPGVYLLSIRPSMVDKGWSIMGAKCDSREAAEQEMTIGKNLDRALSDYHDYEIVEVETLDELKAHAKRIRDSKSNE